MTLSGWAWRVVLALVGIFAGTFVGQELVGGEALGWMVTGAIAAPCCDPLFRTLFARNAALAQAARDRDPARRREG